VSQNSKKIEKRFIIIGIGVNESSSVRSLSHWAFFITLDPTWRAVGGIIRQRDRPDVTRSHLRGLAECIWRDDLGEWRNLVEKARMPCRGLPYRDRQSPEVNFYPIRNLKDLDFCS